LVTVIHKKCKFNVGIGRRLGRRPQTETRCLGGLLLSITTYLLEKDFRVGVPAFHSGAKCGNPNYIAEICDKENKENYKKN